MNTDTKETSSLTQNGNCLKPLLDAVFGNSEEEILKIQSKSVDIICIDPPYLYLKNQKLERKFDENLFFQQCYRILANNGFIIMFGRGSSFYRWNTILEKLGLEFKEEIIWNKSHGTSPLMPLSRVHETISIFGKGKAKINKVKIPYLEQKSNDTDSICKDIIRMKSVLNNTKSLDAVLNYLQNNERDTSDSWAKNMLSISSNITKEDRSVSVIRSVKDGMNEKSIIRTDFYENDNFTKFDVTGKRMDGDRCVKVANSITQGMNEKSIIKEIRDHYTAIHPTQKPVRLLERLIQLCLPDKPKEEILVVDFFAGSFSCGEACFNLGINFKGFEIDEEYFNLGNERLKKLQYQTRLF